MGRRHTSSGENKMLEIMLVDGRRYRWGVEEKRVEDDESEEKSFGNFPDTRFASSLGMRFT
jgi:hypothetical protein